MSEELRPFTPQLVQALFAAISEHLLGQYRLVNVEETVVRINEINTRCSLRHSVLRENWNGSNLASYSEELASRHGQVRALVKQTKIDRFFHELEYHLRRQVKFGYTFDHVKLVDALVGMVMKLELEPEFGGDDHKWDFNPTLGPGFVASRCNTLRERLNQVLNSVT
ncbi:MAG TPA: hypothetical protein VFT87_02635 [Candidatus Saccharimonadales bacterium]|nr:hypothetical protein [Candidatus Saccharimonadales bacterium]